MGSIEVMTAIIGAIIVLTISLIYWLIKPYSEPIVTEGKIVDKYEITDRTTVLSLNEFGGYYMILDSFHILVLMRARWNGETLGE